MQSRLEESREPLEETVEGALAECGKQLEKLVEEHRKLGKKLRNFHRLFGFLCGVLVTIVTLLIIKFLS